MLLVLMAAATATVRLLAFPARSVTMPAGVSIAMAFGVLVLGALAAAKAVTARHAPVALLIAGTATVAVVAWSVKTPEERGWVLAAVGMWLLGLYWASAEFSRRLVRVVAAVAVILILLLVAKVGRDAVSADHLAEARGDATVLEQRLAGQRGPLADAARASVNTLCTDAAGSVDGDTCSAAEVPSGSERTVALARATADRDVARLVAAATNLPDDQKRLTDAQAALDHAAALAQDHPDAVGAVDALSRGGNELISAVHGFHTHRLPLELDLVGWSIVAALAILYYRTLEIRSGRDGIGPVAFTDLANADATPEINSEFRRAVLRNVPEPGAVPGGDAIVPVNDLLDAAGDRSSKIAQALFGLIQAALAVPSGYTVDGSLHQHGHRADVFLRIRDTRTKATLTTMTQSGRDPLAAARAAGYRAAAYIVSRSRIVPGWACWSENSSLALALCNADWEPPLARLEQAVVLAPRSGLALVQLGHSYQLEGRHRDALTCYTRAALLYPRYLVARYRIAVSLCAVADDLEGQWWQAREEQRAAVLAELRRFARLTGTSRLSHAADSIDLEAPLQEDPARCLLLAACEQVEQARRLLTWSALATNAFRRSERAFWSHFIRLNGQGHRARMRLRLINRTSELAVRKRLTGTSDAHALEQAAQPPHTWWQVPYNLACARAVPGPGGVGPLGDDDRAHALELLERSRECEGSWQMDARWVKLDPDLRALHADARFQQFLHSIRVDGITVADLEEPIAAGDQPSATG